MPDFIVKLERTVTRRETGTFVVSATDLGEAESLARQHVRSGLGTAMRWRTETAELRRPVVVDIEEAPASPGHRAA
ncbi:hypothetical protein J2X65_004548 [Ancylobacter sp. 3268]|uniref:hypothetical protein n=1 Tax=Ancylobacter sp. 3268 TaxID=2817752 RepID=UPI00285D2430|nr:hypothetical protein [Ancylobacter sp. 3268]MDR6955169.1 hypothetical protein [Ancylobacter sp. 3268]